MKMKYETGSKAFCPTTSDVKNASNGDNGASRGGTKREFPSSVNGGTFARPAAQNNATKGQTDGHNMGRPGQTRSYPSSGPTSAASNDLSSKSGKNEFVPKSGDAKMASSGEGPNSKGGMSRSFPKKGGKGMSY